MSEKKDIIGLTGGVASGKTAATDYLKELGFSVVDADEVSRFLSRDGGENDLAVKAAFPSAVVGGKLDRAKLKSIVFSDADKLALLNGITHPPIFREVEKRLEASDGFTVLSAPLLFETGMQKYCRKTVLITASRETRIARLIRRDNISVGLAAAVSDSQMSDEEKLRLADHVVTNDGDIEELRKKLSELFKSLRGY